MGQSDFAQQALVEREMLNHLIGALRATMAWQVEGDDWSRRLSTLRFIAQSFQRHLGRLMALEEYDGYMNVVMEASPHLSRAVNGLKQEHAQFRIAAVRIVHRLEGISADDHPAFARVCDDLQSLLQVLDEHHVKEAELLHEAFARDGGGEG
jgi:hypothetical protein